MAAVAAVAVAVVVVVLAAGPWGAGSPSAPPATGRPPERASAQTAARWWARYFLDRYELPDGRVVRWDQGGDTVSEGQAYAMLVAVAVGDQGRFRAAWHWAVAHLEQPSGLLAWHWAAGKVTGAEPAADADADAAWALTLASRRFDQPAYRADAVRLASAILTGEVVPDDGHPALVAGPWATGPTPVLNPSYDAPVDFDALAGLGGIDGEWADVAADARQELSQLLAGGHLPPDWAVLTTTGPSGSAGSGDSAHSADSAGSGGSGGPGGSGGSGGSDKPGGGVAHPTGTPGSPGSPVIYGFDAVRVPVLLAASCDPADRTMAAQLWPTLRRQVTGGILVGLDLGGSPQPSASDNPVGLVGAAGAAQAAGQAGTATHLLNRASAADVRHPTYYGTAWVTLGRLMLQTADLGGCGPGTTG